MNSRRVSPASYRAPRDEIVAVATQLFAEQGFDQTTMSEIARAAGLQQSSLYYWFNRKEVILQAVFERIGAGSRVGDTERSGGRQPLFGVVPRSVSHHSG